MNNTAPIYVERGPYKTYIVRLKLALDGENGQPLYRYIAKPRAPRITVRSILQAKEFKTVESAVDAIKAYRLDDMKNLFSVVDVMGHREE